MKKVSLEKLNKLELVRISTCGSVDDGKSTLIGRLLYECEAIFEDNLLSTKKASERTGLKEIDFSLLLDGLSAEREQKITIDVAYRFFTTRKRRFIISDVPGHEQYTRNMVTGISNANVALILIDAGKGLLKQTKRHLFIASLLGVKHVLVVVNKMDLVNYKEEIFENIRSSVIDFAKKLSIDDLQFIPVSALKGEMLRFRSENLKWYKGFTLIDYLENIYIESDNNLIDLRFPVQTIIRPNQNFRGYAGRVCSGRLSRGQKVLVYPGKKSTTIKEIFYDFKSQKETFSPQSALVTLADELDISRGDMIVRENNIPFIGRNFQSIIFWFSEEPLNLKRSYILKQTTISTRAEVNKLFYKFNVNNINRQQTEILNMNDIGKVNISTNDDLFFDAYDQNKSTGSFILIDDKNFNTVAAGLIIKNINVKNLNKKNKEGMVIWFTGLSGSGKSTLAKKIYNNFKKRDLPVEWLDGDDFRNKFNFDLGFDSGDRIKNIQRAAFVAKMLTKNGINVIGSFITPYEEQRNILRKNFKKYVEVFVDSSLAVCQKRDSKGHYEKANAGEIKNFTGIGDIFEEPKKCNIHLFTDKYNINICVKEILSYIFKN